MENEIVIYRTTVNEMKAKLIEKNLINETYFNLGKVPNLRIVNSGFMEILRKKFKKRQKEISDLINIKLPTLRKWESNNSIPFYKLTELAVKLNFDKVDLLELINGSEFTFGSHHGKNRIKIPIKPKDFKLVKYLVPNSNQTTYLVKNAPPEVKKYIKENFPIDWYTFNKSGLIIIYSYLLNIFLKTFYRYEYSNHIKFPLSPHVKKWKCMGADIKKSIILPILLSDGGEKPQNRIFCSGESDVIHRIWSDALHFSYNILPSSYKLPVKNKTIFITTHKINNKIKRELKSICPSFKTCPYKQKENDYLHSPQPVIKFLFKANSLGQKIAIRIWASTDGNTGVHLDKRRGLITPNLKIGCAHPSLVKELKKLLELNGINTSVTYTKGNWSGIDGIISSSINSLINFLDMGGFIDGIKISRKSKYYYGIAKQDVLLSIFEFMKRQRENSKLRITDSGKINRHIRRIALNRSFKNKEYYVKYFGG